MWWRWVASGRRCWATGSCFPASSSPLSDSLRATHPRPLSAGSARCQSRRSRKRAAASVRRVCGSAAFLGLSRLSDPPESGVLLQPAGKRRIFGLTDGRTRWAPRRGQTRLGSARPPLCCGGKTRTEARSVRSASRRPPARTPAFLPENGRIHWQFRWVPAAARAWRITRSSVRAAQEDTSRTRLWRLYTCHCCIYQKYSAPPLRRLQGHKTNSSPWSRFCRVRDTPKIKPWIR